MKAKNKVVYVPPVYEDVQHEVTSVDDKNNPLRTSFHTDFMLGKMPIGKAESILRQTPYKHLLDLNIQQNEWSL